MNRVAVEIREWVLVAVVSSFGAAGAEAGVDARHPEWHRVKSNRMLRLRPVT
jgi:hypothetical protein